mgnify:CR=1 FL=1
MLINAAQISSAQMPETCPETYYQHAAHGALLLKVLLMGMSLAYAWLTRER